MSDQEEGPVTTRRGRPIRNAASKSDEANKALAKASNSRSKKNDDDEVVTKNSKKKKTVKEVEPEGDNENGDEVPAAKASKKKNGKEAVPVAEKDDEDEAPAAAKPARKKAVKEVEPEAGEASDDDSPVAVKPPRKKATKEAEPEGEKQNGGERKTKKRAAGKETPPPDSTDEVSAPVKKGKSKSKKETVGKQPSVEKPNDSDEDIDEGVVTLSDHESGDGVEDDKSGGHGSPIAKVDDEDGGAEGESDPLAEVVPTKRGRGRAPKDPAAAKTKPAAAKPKTGKRAK